MHKQILIANAAEKHNCREQAIILIDGGRESVGVGTFSEGLRADYFGRCSSVNASHLGCKAKLTQGMNRF